jgi:hypothetical protein
MERAFQRRIAEEPPAGSRVADPNALTNHAEVFSRSTLVAAHDNDRA